MAAPAMPRLGSLITTPLVVVSAVFPVLSFLSIYLRFAARKQSRQPLHHDDWWIVISWVTSFALSVHVWIFAGLTGVDYMKVDPMTGIQNSLKCLWLASCLVMLPLGAVKVSILLFYKRIFKLKPFEHAVYFTCGLIFCWTVIFFFLVFFQLDPISGAWTGVGRLRFDSAKLGLAQVGSSIAFDVIVLCFPLPVISRLQLQRKKKWAVGLILWLGLFCVVAAVVRLVLLNQSIHAVLDSVGFSNIFVQWKNFTFMILEPNCSIIAACLPCYGPLFKGGKAMESIIRSVRSVFSLRSQGSGGAGSGYNRFGERNGVPSETQSATESQIELQNKNRAFTNVERVSHASDEENRMGQINVTKGIEVVRH